uniref:Integrase catalytic domain-containing protein n=1 Tax=Haplochromis burtoni TaxID=8153 RepID=A0A3Q2VPW7_HAPBU
RHCSLRRPFCSTPTPPNNSSSRWTRPTSGVGAVLSQRSGPQGKLQPCAYFSRRLTPTERNYDVGDKELLAIKLALEEWRHWLERAEQPFLIWTDHKNLIYLRTAKRLNSRQARWSLFFTRFNFTLSYRPGSRNAKPDALSRQYSPDTETSSPTTILFRLHGIPLDIVSDRGPQFTSQVWRTFCSILGARVSLSSGFHPQSNGQTERLNQELEAALRCMASQNPTSWVTFLPWVEYAHNSLTSSATGLSPFEASLGYQPPLFPEDELGLAVPSARHHLRRCQRVWLRARQALLRTKEQHTRHANRRRTPAPDYQPGQKVWLAAKNIPLHVSSRKLAPRFIGPYEVDAVVNPAAVRLKLPTSWRIHPTFHVSQVKPVRRSPLCPPSE